MSSEWVICRKCGLKYRARESSCPRCEHPTEEGQARFTADGTPPLPPETNPFVIALPVGLVLAALGTWVFLGPLGGRSSGGVTMALVAAGLLLVFVSWAWTATVAFREGLGWVFFAILAPFVSVAVLRKWKALGVKLTGVALVVLGVGVFAPATGLARDIARACEAKASDAQDCACIGAKTAGLMLPEDRQKPFDRDSAQVRELMLTAGQLCLKDRLVARCVAGNQGSEALCLCVTDAALNAFTPAELSETVDRVNAGAAPAKYAALRADCQARLEAPKKRP